MAGVNHQPGLDVMEPRPNATPIKFHWSKFILLMTIGFGPSIGAGIFWGWPASSVLLFYGGGLMMLLCASRYNPSRKLPRMSYFLLGLGNIFWGTVKLCRIINARTIDDIFLFSAGILFLVNVPVMLHIRIRFSLRTMFIVMTAIALIMGLISSWPNHVASLQIPRIDVKPGLNDLTNIALTMNISQRWGRKTIQLKTEDSFNESVKAELFWLESGKLRHLMIADQGNLLADKITVDNEPLVLGVVVYHPKVIYIVVRQIHSNGHVEGQSVTYEASNPLFTKGIESWGEKYLEKMGNKP
jgi:hypothetical protein